MKIFSAKEMREIDKKAMESLKIPSLNLMENAAKGVVKAILDNHPPDSLRKGIMICAGRGNNGGDGIAVGRILKALGFAPKIFVLGKKEELSKDAFSQVEMYYPQEEITYFSETRNFDLFSRELANSCLIIDALLGTGIKGAARGVFASVIKEINASGAEVLSVDVPSGIPGDLFVPAGEAVRAKLTATMGAPKIPLLTPECEEFVGKLVVVNTGLPEAALNSVESRGEALDYRWFSLNLKERSRGVHKGDMGHLLLIAGSSGKFGASILAGLGALKAGAGLLTIAVPEGFAPFVTSKIPESMTLPLPSTAEGTISSKALDQVFSFIKNVDAVAIGPGLTNHPETAAFAREIYKDVKLPVVVDADAINAFENEEKLLLKHKGERVLTPHPGELGRILKLSPSEVVQNRYALCLEKAKEWNLSLLVKGYRSFIAGKEGQMVA